MPAIPRQIDINSRGDLILWLEDFESSENIWSFGSGWALTTDDYSSATHSMNSPNDASTENGSWNLLSPALLLPELGTKETMHFGFNLHVDMPDSDGDGDGYLEDYYNFSILDMLSNAWHSSDLISDSGNNFWCGDEVVGGYQDSWIQYLDTPSILLGSDGILSARFYYAIESSAGAEGEVVGSCTDGWDVANIRISTNGGSSWQLLEDPDNLYHFDCGYGWIWNDVEYDTGGALNHLAKGWSGNSENWLDFNADLSNFSGENVIIRFAFGSDPAYSTQDDNTLTGFQVDDILIEDNSGILFSDNGNDMSQMTAGGEAWEDQFYDYGSVEDGRPGTIGWEENGYQPGFPFNGNILLDISDFAEKTIQFRIQTRYDDNHDGGQGEGLFIDDFMIYKLAIGAYYEPLAFNAAAGDAEVVLTWEDMNASGNGNFIYDNGIFELVNTMTSTWLGVESAWVGKIFDIVGTSTVDTVKIYNSLSNSDTTITIQAYGMWSKYGYDVEPLHSISADISLGWNSIPVDWEMNNPFIIAHQINGTFGGALDATAFYDRSVINYGGSWKKISEVFVDPVYAEFGIRANITYAGAGVTYNLYRDDTSIASSLSTNIYTDSNVENNVTYEYAVSATYSDGEESAKTDSIIVTPFPKTVHEVSYDDGSFETEFSVGSGNFSAVRFSAGSAGEDIVRFKWFQYGDIGTFYIKVFEDDDGIPGAETYSVIQASGNVDGWNEKDMSMQGLNVAGDFWIGTKEFSSSKPFGLDTNSNAGNSYKREGSSGDWIQISGNLGYHIYLDCTSDTLDECDVCGGSGIAAGTCDCDGNVDLGCGCGEAGPAFECCNTSIECSESDCLIEGDAVWPGDTNSDGVVNVNDILPIGLYWDSLACENSIWVNDKYKWEAQPLPENNCVSHADANGDGSVDIADILVIMVNWNKVPINTDEAPYVMHEECNIQEDDLSRYYGKFSQIYYSLGSDSKAEIQMRNRLEDIFGFVPTPSIYQIGQNYPNPFNPSTSIPFYLSKESKVKLSVFDLLGRQVIKKGAYILHEGSHEIIINGQALSSGVYFYQFTIDSNELMPKKMVLLK